MRADLNKMTLQGEYENVNDLNSLIIESDRGSSSKVFVNVSDQKEEWYELEGVVKKGISVLKFNKKDTDRGTPVQARTVEISIRDSSLHRPIINRLSVVYVPGTQPDDVQ